MPVRRISSVAKRGCASACSENAVAETSQQATTIDNLDLRMDATAYGFTMTPQGSRPTGTEVSGFSVTASTTVMSLVRPPLTT